MIIRPENLYHQSHYNSSLSRKFSSNSLSRKFSSSSLLYPEILSLAQLLTIDDSRDTIFLNYPCSFYRENHETHDIFKRDFPWQVGLLKGRVGKGEVSRVGRF